MHLCRRHVGISAILDLGARQGDELFDLLGNLAHPDTLLHAYDVHTSQYGGVSFRSSNFDMLLCICQAILHL